MKTKALSTICLLAALFCIPTARAAVTMTLEQVGPNVVGTGTGTIDLTGLTVAGSGQFPAQEHPSEALLLEGDGGNFTIYSGASGPTSFGTGSDTPASTAVGDPLGP